MNFISSNFDYLKPTNLISLFEDLIIKLLCDVKTNFSFVISSDFTCYELSLKKIRETLSHNIRNMVIKNLNFLIIEEYKLFLFYSVSNIVNDCS